MESTKDSPSTGSALSGFQLAFEGARLLLRERRLWALAAAPVALSLCAFAAALTLLVAYAGDLYGWATVWMPTLEAASWYAWLWIGPAKAALAVVGALLFAMITGIGLLTAFLVANVLASPFLDLLAYRVELIETGAVRGDSGSSGVVRDALRSLREELRRTGFFLAVVAGLVVLGFVIPGAQLVTGPAITAFAIFFLPLDYASYTLDRRRLSFRQKRDWLLANKRAVVGFGAAAFMASLLPGLNFVAMPLLVVGGTLLALRHDPDAVIRPPGADAGTATSP